MIFITVITTKKKIKRNTLPFRPLWPLPSLEQLYQHPITIIHPTCTSPKFGLYSHIGIKIFSVENGTRISIGLFFNILLLFFIFLTSLLEYNCLTMVCWFLLLSQSESAIRIHKHMTFKQTFKLSTCFLFHKCYLKKFSLQEVNKYIRENGINSLH